MTQSSAWRGRGSPGGWLALTELSDYITDLQHTVVLIPVKKILLAGTSGDTLVSVQNGLDQFYLPGHGLAIAVRVGAAAELGSSLTGDLASRSAGGESGYDRQRQAGSPLHHHRDHHIAATVADKGWVATDLGEGVRAAQRGGHQVRAD